KASKYDRKTVVSLTAPAAASPSVIDPSSARIRGSRQIQLVVHLSREFSVDCPAAQPDACGPPLRRARAVPFRRAFRRAGLSAPARRAHAHPRARRALARFSRGPGRSRFLRSRRLPRDRGLCGGAGLDGGDRRSDRTGADRRRGRGPLRRADRLCLAARERGLLHHEHARLRADALFPVRVALGPQRRRRLHPFEPQPPPRRTAPHERLFLLLSLPRRSRPGLSAACANRQFALWPRSERDPAESLARPGARLSPVPVSARGLRDRRGDRSGRRDAARQPERICRAGLHVLAALRRTSRDDDPRRRRLAVGRRARCDPLSHARRSAFALDRPDPCAHRSASRRRRHLRPARAGGSACAQGFGERGVSPPLLRVEGLAKSFGALAVTDDVSFSVDEGRLVALIGPNGAGKTTLIDQLSGALRSDAGRIHFGGLDISAFDMPERAELGFARSFQIAAVLPEYTALENVALAVQARSGSSFRFFGRAAREERLNAPARAALERVGLL